MPGCCLGRSTTQVAAFPGGNGGSYVCLLRAELLLRKEKFLAISVPRGSVMLPVLVHAGNFTIFSYGVMTALGFLLAIIVPVHLAKNEGLSAAKMEGLGLVIVLTAGVGSKLLTAFDYPGFYSGGWNHFFFDQMLGKGGVFYGGFLMATSCAFLYCRIVGLPGWQVSDCVAPGLALAQGLGRIGCYLAGCCWGTPTQLPLGVTYTSEIAHQLTGVPLNLKIHPTQLYEAAIVLLAIPFLMWLRRTKTFQGQVFLAYVTYYAVARFFLEFVRDDPRGRYLGNLFSTSQLISLLMLPFAIYLFFYFKTRNRQDSVPALRLIESPQVRRTA
jgi:phosphatidylglycerol:prolipoprotein diacylglycerol transferase